MNESHVNEIIDEDIQYITGSHVNWHSFEDSSILITGANGMLPAYMVETLLFLNKTTFKKPAKIFALIRNKQKSEVRFKRYLGNKNLIFITQDIITPLQINNRTDYIIHAASKASPKYYSTEPASTISANVIGTYNILEYAKHYKPKGLLFFSSGAVYGDMQDNTTKNDENSYGYLNPLELRSCYSEGKRAAETMCMSYSKQYGIHAKIVRPFHTYGPGMELDDGRVFADFISNIVNNQDIVLKSKGTATRPFCYISDATIAFFTVLLEGESAQAYNIANPSCIISIKNLADLLVELFHDKKLKVVQDYMPTESSVIASKMQGFIPDINKMLKLGWSPNISIEEGFRRTIRSFL